MVYRKEMLEWLVSFVAVNIDGQISTVVPLAVVSRPKQKWELTARKKTMNLERMKQTAVEKSKEQDNFAVVATDGAIEFCRTMDEAMTVMDSFVDMRESMVAKRHDYAIVRLNE